MRRLSWFIAPALALASGCSLLVDVSGLADSAPTKPDAAVDSAQEGSDAASDGPAAADADAGQRFCAVQGPLHTFCADFDEPGSAPTTAWDGSSSNLEIVSGKVAIDPSASTSPPASLSTSLDPNDGGATFHANVTRSYAQPTPNIIRCEFDLRFDRGPTNFSVGAFDLKFDDFGIELGVNPDGSMALYEYPTNTSKSAGAVVKGVWTHIAMALDRSMPSASVSVNGSVVLQYGPQNVPSSPAVGAFQIGFAGETGSQPGCEFHYDNVTCDVQ